MFLQFVVRREGKLRRQRKLSLHQIRKGYTLAQKSCESPTPQGKTAVQFAYELASTRCALKDNSFNSHHQDQTRAAAGNPQGVLVPIDFFFLLLLVKGIHGASALGIFLSLIDVGIVFNANAVFHVFFSCACTSGKLRFQESIVV
eukprot:1156803-Pelagomonas_calceolata.AAC.1